MKIELEIPAFMSKTIISEKTTTTEIKRQDDTLLFEFPLFEEEEVLKYTRELALKKRRAHDRDIDEVLDVIEQVGELWRDPNYHYRKEAMEILPLMTGESKELVEVEFLGTLKLWTKKSAEEQLFGEIGGKEYLEDWIRKQNVRIHAQPRGLILHNMAGNAFNLGMLTIFYGLITKNVNLIKLSHDEPYLTVRFCESIAEVDKKIAKELAALYWKGSHSHIYDALFNSGYVDGVLAWGGIQSIEEIKRRAYHYGIKVISHGPKLSFSIVSEDKFKNAEQMKQVAQKMAVDVACWNQKACLSPRVIYVIEKPHRTSIYNENGKKKSKNSNQNFEEGSMEDSIFSSLNKISRTEKARNYNLSTLMKRSVKMLKNEYSDVSPRGFARMIAEGLKNMDIVLPRANLTHTDGLEMERKRQYFFLNYVTDKKAEIITAPNNRLDWTVVYMRELPAQSEIDMCQNRFVIVARVHSIQDLIYSIRKEKLKPYLQTISIYGSDDFVKEVAEEFSLIGAYRFPRIGEHNIQPVGIPWDGHYTLQDMIKWVYIGYLEDESEETLDYKVNLYEGVVPNGEKEPKFNPID